MLGSLEITFFRSLGLKHIHSLPFGFLWVHQTLGSRFTFCYTLDSISASSFCYVIMQTQWYVWMRIYDWGHGWIRIDVILTLELSNSVFFMGVTFSIVSSVFWLSLLYSAVQGGTVECMECW